MTIPPEGRRKRAGPDSKRFSGTDPGGRATLPALSVIVPAFNEERGIGETLDRLRAAAEVLRVYGGTPVQILVVDNASTDRTAAVAIGRGATVIGEADHNIGKVRNTGARAASHDVLVFLDADTLMPAHTLLRIAQVMATSACVGGAVDAAHEAQNPLVRAYLKAWRLLGFLAGMTQGACQFCRRAAFAELGGYDDRMYMGEDVDFVWRLGRLARKQGRQICLIRDLQVSPSARRFDTWPLWRTLVMTNPAVILALRRHRSPWAGWYDKPPR